MHPPSALARGLKGLRGQRLRRSNLRAGVALVYHRVGDPGGDRSRELVPNMATGLFRAQMAHLRERYAPVAAADLPEAAASRRAGAPFPVAVTFDDDLPTHRLTALPILSEQGMPATFFVGGASFDGWRPFWWERLQAAADADRLDTALIEMAIGPESGVQPGAGALKPLARAIEALPPERLAKVDAELADRASPEPGSSGMSVEDVSTLAAAGCEIGLHPVRHQLMTGLDDPAVDAALLDGRERLADTAGHEVRLLSYPHGKADARIASRVGAHGYRAAYTGRPEAVKADTDPLLLGRVEPSLDSLGDFARQLRRTLAGAAADQAA